MKLNKTKVRYILRQNRKGVATEEIALDVKVSQRRVQQIIKSTMRPGKNLSWAKKVGRPRQNLHREGGGSHQSKPTLVPLWSANAGDCDPEAI